MRDKKLLEETPDFFAETCVELCISDNAVEHLRRYSTFLCGGECSDLRTAGDENGEGISINFEKTLAEYKVWLAKPQAR